MVVSSLKPQMLQLVKLRAKNNKTKSNFVLQKTILL